ncbi:isoprenylcysteine carboxylmethyltransferase family protein [Sporosarcina thermotolerans]|uniref:Isoprenylcysteine carboxylmethyltransferase family protein n=1 Tax=Sporosarcina thermotolerans TaxID=633404 RepID=A0AAW9A570_9BACL|nr:isoprenylcysteine carboxylmethyltransferase family protein [Sporosarcina thermotolerans]MDW0116019.1 isoprenylcysteine carboxylmethyltransferase family protein [Sporosarcina thermotolerans]WHT49799.1 isoprenylcysteine carboxylmethyltransferase family protein [Sporosarcina thermotolerans]
MLFGIVISIVILQRLIELFIARRNEKWMKSQGAFEAGATHYPFMVGLHILFFISLLTEVLFFNRELSLIWPFLLAIFLVTQLLRIWCLSSLGKFWNTKIIVLPNAQVVRKGPYKWIRHPNYIIVATELLVLPLLFNAFFTAVLFTLLNCWMMTVRIPTEEKALKEATNYTKEFLLNK